MSIQKVKSRLYVETELMGANLGCVDTEQGLVLIDTPYLPDEIRRWQEAIAELSDRKIAYVINTDQHFDHCLGNALLSPNVIAHQLAYEEMTQPDGTMRHYFVSASEDLTAEVKKQVYDIPIGLPRYTFSDRMWLHLGDATLELIHMGGHTASTIVIYLIEDRVLLSGDVLVSNMHPYKGQANFRQWIAALEKIQEMDIDVIVPGHGEICDKAEAGRMLEYFRQMWDRVLSLRREGCTKEEIVERARDLINFYPVEAGMEAQASMRFDEGIARLYDEMEAPPGGPE